MMYLRCNTCKGQAGIRTKLSQLMPMKSRVCSYMENIVLFSNEEIAYSCIDIIVECPNCKFREVLPGDRNTMGNIYRFPRKSLINFSVISDSSEEEVTQVISPPKKSIFILRKQDV